MLTSKIAFVRLYPPNNDKFYNTQEIGLMKALSHYCDCMLIMGGENGELRDGKLRVKTLPIVYKSKGQTILRGLYMCLKQYRPDTVIVGGDYVLFAPVAILIAKLLGAKVWLYEGVYSQSKMRHKIAHLAMDVIQRKLTTGVFAKTYHTEKLLLQRGYQNISVMGVGLNIGQLKTLNTDCARNTLSAANSGKLILHVGELSERRFAEQTLQLLRYLVERDDKISCVVIGEGPLKNAKEFCHPRIKFIGAVLQSEIARYYEAADALVNAYHEEIFGMTHLEALYFNCPCICHASSPGPYYLNEKYPDMVKLVNSLEGEAWYTAVCETFAHAGKNDTSARNIDVSWDAVAENYYLAMSASEH